MECVTPKRVGSLRRVPFYPAVQSRVKYVMLDIATVFLGAAFEVVSRNVPELKRELADWEDGRRFALGILPKGPFVTLEKQGTQVNYLGKGLKAPDVSFFFKNMDAGLPIFLGLKSTHAAVAECKVLIQGNNAYAMEVNRAISTVLTYLFPVRIFKHLFKEVPRLEFSQLINKAKVYGALMPAFIRNLRV